MFQIKDILPNFADAVFVGNAEATVRKIIASSEIQQGQEYNDCIIWIGDKYVHLFTGLQAVKTGLVILTANTYETLKGSFDANFLIVESPRLVFASILKLKFMKKKAPGIDPTASIHPDVVIPDDCYIGKNVVIEKNVTIGHHCVINHNTCILEDTYIGNFVVIGCNNTIGNFGFGYEKNEEGMYEVIEHIGGVHIEDHVHIHNNTCIDRGVLGLTYIGENVKIDNLVHVAHGVRIEKNSLIIANAMLGGSVQIGENCWIAPSTTIKNKVTIADNTLAGLGCVILKDTENDSVMIGNPAVKIEEYKQWSKLKEQLYLNFNTDLK